MLLVEVREDVDSTEAVEAMEESEPRRSSLTLATVGERGVRDFMRRMTRSGDASEELDSRSWVVGMGRRGRKLFFGILNGFEFENALEMIKVG